MALQDSLKKLIEDLNKEAKGFYKSYIQSLDNKHIGSSMRMLSLYVCTRRFMNMLQAILEKDINE